jgi:hypothetical protein
MLGAGAAPPPVLSLTVIFWCHHGGDVTSEKTLYGDDIMLES